MRDVPVFFAVKAKAEPKELVLHPETVRARKRERKENPTLARAALVPAEDCCTKTAISSLIASTLSHGNVPSPRRGLFSSVQNEFWDKER